MKQLGYGKYIEQAIGKAPYGTLLWPKTIAKNMAKKFILPPDKAITICNLKLKRLTDNGSLVRLIQANHFRES
jgi:hypothetical protein